MIKDTDQPTGGPDSDTTSVQLGMAFTASKAGQITGVRFYKNPANLGTHTVALWKDGTKLAEATVVDESTSGWQTGTFSAPVPITKSATYVVSYLAPAGRYAFTPSGLAAKITSGPLSTLAGGGRYSYGSGALTGTSNTNYFVDPIFAYSDTTAPTVASTSPGNNATSVPVKASVKVTFSADIQSGTANVVLKNKTSGATIAGSLSSESQRPVVTFTPAGDLDPGTDYTVSVSGAKSLSGASMSGTTTKTFTTAGASACPCSLMDTSTVPTQVDAGDTDAVTLGLKFKPSVDGFVTGVRYYRSADNTGTHTGRLWSSDGTELAKVTFNDSGTGWQTASFDSRIAVNAGTTYVVGYYAPKGHYSADLHTMDDPVVNAPLSSVTPNSVYASGDKFPNSTYGGANYYVDVVFETQDTDPPSITNVTPDSGSTEIAVATKPKATFARAITASTLSFTLKAADGTAVAGQAAYDSDSKTATFTPSAALAYSTKYTATVTASSKAGVAMTDPKVWSFTTDSEPLPGTANSLYADTDVPEVPAWDDSDGVEVGVRFSSSKAGTVTAVKFYAGAGNTATKVTLWSATGDALGTGTATTTGSGWRTVKLSTPVDITAGTTYVASYYAAAGHYSVTRNAYSSAVTVGPLTVPAGGSGYKYPSGFPSSGVNHSYGVDVVLMTQ